MICPFLFQKLSKCKEVEFSADFLVVFADLQCYIFRVWRARAWNALWRHCVIFYACGDPSRRTNSGSILLYFLRVEHAMATFCYIF